MTDRWDEEAEKVLPCDGGWLESQKCIPRGANEFHRAGCPAQHRFAVAALARRAYSKGRESMMQEVTTTLPILEVD